MDSRSFGVGDYGYAAEMAFGFALHPYNRWNRQLDIWSSADRKPLMRRCRGIAPQAQPSSRYRRRMVMIRSSKLR
jgi:hypothetical protein